MTRTRLLILAALLAAIAALAFLTTRPDQASDGLLAYRDATTIARGETLYAEHCAACHGANLQGEPDWRTPDAEGYMPAPPHDPTGHTWHHPDAQLFAITKFGTQALVGGTYKSRMEGYENILSDADIRATLAYIKSTWPPDIIARHNRINANATD
ncbi:cytochrome c [Rhodobacteraceae bacterium D3-12]|nr:cytochrome c [Rhodobacteraceae bacterium D3-12]